MTNVSRALIQPTNVTTGDDNRARYLYYQLKLSMARAERIDLIVSFLMESGVAMILEDQAAAIARGARVRILTGNYLGITQPSALYMIRSKLGDAVDLRFYNQKDRSFHPKSYIFHYRDHSEIFIGSSNVSRSALTSGIEWNYRFSSTRDPEDYQQFFEAFEDLFTNHSIVIDDEELRRYSKNWHKPAVYRDLNRYDDRDGILDPPDAGGGQQAPSGKVSKIFRPRGAQIEALYALQESRSEGAAKALVQAATGIGKTFLAAFDSQNYRKVLFVAHREEILKQAAETFASVREGADIGFFGGSRRETGHDLTFAMVETLGKKEYLNGAYFQPDAFDYIVIDEFHHAVTEQYRNIIRYFRPKFLLGLTATPERMDGRNIYELCDYNVPFELSLRDAINKGFLVPFHYYGIYDETDYSGLRIVNGRYAEKDLDRAYIGNRKRYDLIYSYYQKYPSQRALGFCSSRSHAEDMAREFNARGRREKDPARRVRAAAVYSGEPGPNALERREALRQLRDGEIQVIFSVDMFNEGLDVPDLDLVMFLRPTQSPVVFLQQLGRGLRRAKGKEYLNVLDFIGNYRKAGAASVLLSGDGKRHGSGTGERQEPGEYPDDCIVDFDLRLIDLFRKMAQRSQGAAARIDEETDRIRDELGRVPTRMELFTHMDDAVYTLCMEYPAKSPFRKYLEYLHRRNWLSGEEQKLYDGIGREFLELISTTSMTKVYKMPVLYAFLGDGEMRTEVTEEQVLACWKEFFGRGGNWKDLVSGKGDRNAGDRGLYEQYLAITDREHLQNIRRNPVHFLIQSGKGFFVPKDGYLLAVRDDLREVFGTEALRQQYQDILDYRTMDYFRRRYVAERG